jgi:hypothetical protein
LELEVNTIARAVLASAGLFFFFVPGDGADFSSDELELFLRLPKSGTVVCFGCWTNGVG